MLKKLKLHNFRTFLNAEIEFTQRHLLIGKNNSGKTNLCSALRFLGATASCDLATSAQLVPGGIDEIKNWGFKSSGIDISCVCTLPFNDELIDFSYDLKLQLEPSYDPRRKEQIELRVKTEQVIIDGPGLSDFLVLNNDGNEIHVTPEDGATKHKKSSYLDKPSPHSATALHGFCEFITNPRLVLFKSYLRNWRYYSLATEKMRYGWRQAEERLPCALALHGDNLATVLYHMKNMDEQRYRRVVEHTRIVEPSLEAINFVPAPNQPPVPFVALRGQQRASWSGLSDGTLLCLGLASLIESVTDPSFDTGHAPMLIVIEEPENGIYPGQLREVFDQFEDRASEGQFIFTSHNPYFINLFDGFRESVTLLRRENERTEIVPVPPVEDDPERFLLAELYSTGLIG